MQKAGVADHQDNQEVELRVVEEGSKEDKVSLAKRRRLVKTVDKKGEGSSSTFHWTTPIKQFFADVVAAEKRGVVKELKHKTPKPKCLSIMTIRHYQFLLLMALSNN